MPSFQITEAPSRLELGNPDAGGLTPPGKATFLVRNMGPAAQVGRISVEPLEGARADWFQIAGAPATSPGRTERDFVYGGNQSVEVTVRPPAGAPAGNFGFRLRVASESDPDTDYVQGPSVAFTLKPAPVAPPPARRIPWWIFAAAAALTAALVGVGVFLFVMRTPATPVPAGLVSQPAEIAAFRVAEIPRPVRFTLSRQGTGVALSVLSTQPAEGEGVDEDAVVDLTVRSPDGPCASLICMFPGAEFPPDVVSALSAEGFDARFAPALTVVESRVQLDAAKLSDIKNAQSPAAMVRLPRLTGLTVTQVKQTLSDLGLGMELNTVTDGPEDDVVRRTEPQAPTNIAEGQIVKVFYRPKPCTSPRCLKIDRVLIAPKVMDKFELRTIQP